MLARWQLGISGEIKLVYFIFFNLFLTVVIKGVMVITQRVSMFTVLFVFTTANNPLD